MGPTFSRGYSKEEAFLRARIDDPTHHHIRGWNDKQISRLHRIMNGDRILGTDTSQKDTREDTFDSEFGEFVASHPEWASESECKNDSESEGKYGPESKVNAKGEDKGKEDQTRMAIFFQRYPHIDHLKVLRRQTSGLCYMHAPVVLQHYLVSIHRGTSGERKMIDVAKYIHLNWKGSALLKYLKEDSGGSSMSFLEEINYHVRGFDTANYTIPPTESRLFESTCTELMERLAFKPALVSNFRVDHQFHHGGTSFLTGSVNTAELSGHHAMVLIGCRACPVHGYVFLLQNWWKGRYFIEVSASYLASSKATISFVTQEIEYIPDCFPVVHSSFVETAVDVGERLDELVRSTN